MALFRNRKKGVFRTLRFLSLLRRNVEAEFSRGNSVTLYKHGGDFFPALFGAFQSASTSISLEYYTINDDSIGREFSDLLLAAAARGVRVSLIYDYVGCIDTPGSYFRKLESGGVRCLPFNPPAFRTLTWIDRRSHRKIAIIDGTTAFMGGMNIGLEYSGYGDTPKNWRDVGIGINGPAVEELTRKFREMWEARDNADRETIPLPAPAPEAAGDADVLILCGRPHHTRSVIRSAFRMAIAGAAEKVRIVTPYFIPGPRVLRSLLRAAMRGVGVEIILPSISDVPLVKLASRAYLSPLLKAGVRIYERKETILHAKVMLIDDSWVTIGSANFDYRSFHRNHELNVVIDSREFCGQVDEMFDEDLAKSRPITLQEHEARSVVERLLERLCHPISRFL
jgi:cardiolipin synthase